MDEDSGALSRAIGARVKQEWLHRGRALDQLVESAGPSHRSVVHVEHTKVTRTALFTPDAFTPVTGAELSAAADAPARASAAVGSKACVSRRRVSAR